MFFLNGESIGETDGENYFGEHLRLKVCFWFQLIDYSKIFFYMLLSVNIPAFLLITLIIHKFFLIIVKNP